MENKTCGECKHLNRELAFCRKCGARWMRKEQPSCDDFEAIKPPTNGDKIRQMSNEEMAVMFRKVIDRCPPGECHDHGCIECWLAWLNTPAENKESEVENV